MEEFLARASQLRDFVITVETNGSLPMLNPMGKGYKVDLYSVSPKLSTSVDWDCKFLTEQQRDHHNSTRINYKNLYDITYLDKDKNTIEYKISYCLIYSIIPDITELVRNPD